MAAGGVATKDALPSAPYLFRVKGIDHRYEAGRLPGRPASFIHIRTATIPAGTIFLYPAGRLVRGNGLMDEADVLEKIADEMAAILSRFKRTREGVWIAEGDEARFTGLVLEARDLMAQGLGPVNNFGLQLESARYEGTANFTGSQSYHSVEQGAGIVRSAVSAIRRRSARSLGVSAGAVASPPYVNLARIEELRAAQSPSFDLRRLVRMCEELNAVFAAGHALASAMLLRAIVDHVPPIFGVENFGQVIASIDGQSPKKSMERLHTSSRDIANRWLHQQIRKSESLPTPTQVDFRQELDALLGEVVGKLRT